MLYISSQLRGLKLKFWKDPMSVNLVKALKIDIPKKKNSIISEKLVKFCFGSKCSWVISGYHKSESYKNLQRIVAHGLGKNTKIRIFPGFRNLPSQCFHMKLSVTFKQWQNIRVLPFLAKISPKIAFYISEGYSIIAIYFYNEICP